ncbi:class I SAM-dependent methyltransferase [Cognatishimia maritima]|uniref:Methyltransferase domain-containing protein n=1 Tax=Cognatishimia maritima TaxID=870908 RepID=A0A1M5L3N7_9RHOB|nr:class I SAM-dependent methyltransferase [Cognatishimia maritima]SHG59409.1 Methyltransferase domain-containing protein [Cognatishimia maritima]
MELDHRYNAAAPIWSQMLEQHRFPAAYRHLASFAPTDRALRMVDVGAGSGDFSTAYCAMRQRPVDHVLLDRADNMLAEAQRAHPQAQTICEDLAAHSPAKPYDVTLCAHVIEHCPDPFAAMSHLARITAPGGTLLLAISKPHFCQVFIWLKWRHRWFSTADITAMGASAGLTLRAVVPFPTGVPSRVSQGYVFEKP